MISWDSKIVFYVVLLLIIFPVDLVAAIDDSNSKLPDLVTEIKYFSSNKDLSIDSVENLTDSSFKKFDQYTIQPDEVFWLRIKIDNRFAEDNEYFTHFNNYLHEVHLYQRAENKKWIERVAGVMVPEKMKAVKGYISDKVPFTISDGKETVLYLKIKNRVVKHLDIRKIRIVDSKSYYRIEEKTVKIQSLFLGLIVILCLFNLLLFIFTQTRIYLYYLLYAIVSSLFFIHNFQYFKSGFFVNYPEINIYFFFSVTVIQAIYSWFLYESVKPDVGKKIVNNLKKYAIGVSAGTVVILVVAVFNFTKGVMLSDIFSLINFLCAVTIVFLLFKKVSKTAKIIFTGSLFLVMGAFSAIILNYKNDVPVHMYSFQAGFVLELIFFTIAINFMYQNERLAKLKAQLKITVLKNEQLNKEKEAQKLRAQIDMSERDLAAKVVAISQKEALIKNVSSQLEQHVYKKSVKIKDIKDVMSDLNLKTDNNFWAEFETHFIKVHPGFYCSLNSLYPGLTTNERRLCAFIKLNLTTKEIANITKRNQGSIHMARTRLRKKMDLERSENLENIISAIG